MSHRARLIAAMGATGQVVEKKDKSLREVSESLGHPPDSRRKRKEESAPAFAVNPASVTSPSGEEQFSFENPPTPRKQRQRPAQPGDWKQNKKRERRERGLEYVSAANKVVRKKSVQPVDCQCGKKCTNLVTDEERLHAFSAFWKLCDQKKRQFLINSVDCAEPTTRRGIFKEGGSRKKKAYCYHINAVDKRVMVCKKFFLATLDVTVAFIRNAMVCRESGNFAGESNRGKTRSTALKDLDRDVIKAHINSFERIPSHYCRARTQREYLKEGMSIQEMYDKYTEYCNSNLCKPANIWKYRQVFKSLNLGFHKPRSDECDICFKHRHSTAEEKTELEQQYEGHFKRKRDVKEFKAKTKEAAERGDLVFLEFDLEAVLYCPSVKAKSLFYKRQLSAYNLTVYDVKTRQASCYCWDETIGARGSNEIASCLFQSLEANASGKRVVLMSDSCTGQNRNCNVSAMLLYAVQTLNIPSITHVYFEPGHSFMECDSVHAHISKAAKDKEIFIPQEWYNIIRRASPKYSVVEMDEFMNVDLMKQNFISGKKANMKWLSLRMLEYRKEDPHGYHFKYDLQEEFMRVDVGKNVQPSDTPVLYSEAKSSVTLEKKKDLVQLCEKVIPARYHTFFKGLKTESPEKREERLAKKERTRLKLTEKAGKAKVQKKKKGGKPAEKEKGKARRQRSLNLE